MAFSSNGKFGFIDVDDVTYLQDTWYNLAQVGSGLVCTMELNASSYDGVGGQHIYVGILPNGGTPPTDLTTLGDLEVIEYGVLLLKNVPFLRNAVIMGNQESVYVYSDDDDVHFRASGIIRSES